jgi:hypothetical protein
VNVDDTELSGRAPKNQGPMLRLKKNIFAKI